MTRGNQRDRDRQKNLEKQAKLKAGNQLSGTQFQKKKEDDAQKMRDKQAKADAKKAAEAAGGKK
ncbi:hypothetical protein BJY04DRAFT_219860 [Aspergillus karnatakaensis]|uniref:4F5 domain protein n=1 Tax=Aspergillus karnatakaensis TaxID=1810916 RepID=UPI003CCCA12C